MKQVLNVGGNSHEILLPVIYDGWQRVLLDIDPNCNPDVVCDARELSRLPASTFDAIYCSHNLEHYFSHDVARVLAGFRHVLKEGGFAHIRVPDMADLMRSAVDNNLDIEDVLYQSPMGPIAVCDVIYGFRSEIKRSGNDFFAHKTGFTEKSLREVLHTAGFSHIYSKTGSFEVAAFAFMNLPSGDLIDLFDLGQFKLRDASSQSVAERGNNRFVPRVISSPEIPDRKAVAPVSEQARLALLTSEGSIIVVPASLGCITTYVLLEQEQWFERELSFLLRWMKAGMNAIDIGANVGVYSIPLARVVGASGHIFAFEPSESSQVFLEAGRQRNGLENLTVSPCALSDSEKEGWLKSGWSSELNALDDAPSGPQAERVRVSSLDIQEQEYQWPSIDFIKIDAELQEARIVAGGRSFFTRHSPLVMYEINRGDSKHHSVRWIFEALGYRTFRLLGDATTLVPLASNEALDPFELNLFAAKPDRATGLAGCGLLVSAVTEYSLTVDERSFVIQCALDQPYSRAFEFSLSDFEHCPFGEALVAYAAYRYGGFSASRRYAALLTGFTILREYCSKNESPTALATLARIGLDLGYRRDAIEALKILVKLTGVEIDQPFFPPCERYEQISPEGRESEWFVAAAHEQFELIRSYSSCFLANEFVRLKWLCESQFSSPAIYRRMFLEGLRQGVQLTDLLAYVNTEHRHQNARFWSESGLSDLVGLLMSH